MSIDFKDTYFHIPTHTIQGIHAFGCSRSILPIQSTTVLSVHSTQGIQGSGEGEQTNGFTQGYKNPPVPR